MTPLEIVLAVFAALGIRELIGVIVRHILNKRKSAAEIDAIHLSNAGKQISDLREAMQLVGTMRREMENDKNVLAQLKDNKIEDDRKIARRDGVIDEQRNELRSLHDEMGRLSLRCSELEKRVTALERENRELVKENLQLKGMEETNGGSQVPDSRE